MATYVALCCTFVSLISLSLGQAPGDIGTYCTSISAIPNYPPTVKRLMDSWSYQTLGGLWTIKDVDNDTQTWTSVVGEPCREKLKVNEPINFPQDNWIITQFINKSIPAMFNTTNTTIYVNISYILDSSCDIVNCYPNFQLLYHLANQPSQGVAMDTNGYTLLANVTSTDNINIHTKTVNFSLTAESTGFYIALRDIGANITITRLFVYRLIGPQMQVNLTLYPETPAPTEDCVNIYGICVANADTTSGMPPTLTLDPSGSWTHADECYCIEGHEPQIIEGTKQCQACPISTYKSALSNTNCQSCPANSESMTHGSSICMCINGYYRAPIETADDSCTAPPSSPINIQTTGATNVTASIMWVTPTSDGGRSDPYYNIYTTNNKNYTRIFYASISWNLTAYNLTNLEPNTIYFIYLVSENGVSNQSANTFREAFTSVKTDIGVAGKVTGVKVVNDTFVEWNILPDSDRGPITQYEVQFFSSSSNGAINTVGRNTASYQVNVTADFPSDGQPVYVRVRGFTNIGAGKWSDAVLFAEAPVVTMTSATPSISTTIITTVSKTTIIETVSKTSSSFTSPVSNPSSTPAPPTTTPTTTPTETPTSNSNAIVSILAVLGGAFLIILLVSIGGGIYFIVRKIRIRYFTTRRRDRDETDQGELIKYEHLPHTDSGDEEHKLTIQ